MPKGTKVHRCVEKVKRKGGVNPYAVCQASTGQSFATGKRTRKSDKKPIGSPKSESSFARRLQAALDKLVKET